MIYKNGTIQNKDFRENESGSTYTINGTVNVTDGIASNFSSTAWITPNFTVADTATLEFDFLDVVPATTRITANHEVLFGSSNANKFKVGIQKSSWKWQFWNGSSWVQSSIVATIGDPFDLKLTWDGSTYVFYVRQKGNAWTKAVTVSSTDKVLYSNLFIGRNSSNNPEFFSGTVDLTKVIFKANNKIVWSGMDAVMTNGNAKVHKNYVASREFYEV